MYQVLANCLLPTAEKFIIMFIDLLFQFYYYQCSVYLLRICSNALKNLSFPSSFIYTCSQVCVCVCFIQAHYLGVKVSVRDLSCP